jgi:hypothetical protein
VKHLHSLDLSENRELGPTVAQALFASERLPSLVHLDLSGTRIGNEGLAALASARGWDRLRHLRLSHVNMGTDRLRALLASPNLQQLTLLALAEDYGRGAPALDVSPELAAEITRLPNLASLRLYVHHCDQQSKQILSHSDALAWALIQERDFDIRNIRAKRAPQRVPPVDFAETWERWLG